MDTSIQPVIIAPEEMDDTSIEDTIIAEMADNSEWEDQYSESLSLFEEHVGLLESSRIEEGRKFSIYTIHAKCTHYKCTNIISWMILCVQSL